MAQCGDHEPPGELGRGIGRSRLHARGDDDAAPRAGLDVDVRPGAALADEPQARQALDERLADRRALADQHQRLGVLQPPGLHVAVPGVIVPDRRLVAVALAVALERAHRVLVVVEDGDVQGSIPRYSQSPSQGLSGSRARANSFLSARAPPSTWMYSPKKR